MNIPLYWIVSISSPKSIFLDLSKICIIIPVDKKRATPVIAYLPAFAFTLAYLLYQYLLSGISNTVSPGKAIRALVVFFALLVVLAFIAYKVIKDHAKAGLSLWLAAELFLFSQKFFIISGIVSVVVVLLWVGLTLFRKKKVAVHYVSFLLTVLGFGLAIGMLSMRVPWALIFKHIPRKAEVSGQALVAPEDPPDIYYIVLDAYARTDVLNDFFGFDNAAFTKYLLEKGFVIPEDNHSNYASTELSITSTLNMQYIQSLLPDAEGWPYWWLLSPLIEDSAVETALAGVGYQSVAVAVDWEVTNHEAVDSYLYPQPVRLNEFEKLLIQTSPLKLFSPVLSKFTLLNTYAAHRELIDFAFTSLAEIPDIEGPTFTFAHITAPHPPFVFDADGLPITPSYAYSFFDGNLFPGTQEQYITGYVDQLQSINQQLENTIDAILEKSETPPIIVIMGDHGSRLSADFINPANTCIREGFSNFAAFYLPGLDADTVPSDITSVNVFRLILDQYFGAKLGMLENRAYFSGNGQFYDYDDVTSLLHQECKVSP